MFSGEGFKNRWHLLSLLEQLGNVGSEVDRAIAGLKKNDPRRTLNALSRALDLLDLTIGDVRWRTGGRLRELTRVREVLCDSFLGENVSDSSLDSLSKYFYHFAFAARRQR